MSFPNPLNIRQRIKCHNSVCYIELLDKYQRPIAIARFDESYLEEVKKHKWYLSFYGYAETKLNGKNFKMHHLPLPVKKGFVVDHIDHNNANNVRSNLRYATHQQNMRNRKNVTGVDWCKKSNKWRPHITVDGKKIYFPRVKNFDEAVSIRREAAKKYFGDFYCNH